MALSGGLDDFSTSLRCGEHTTAYTRKPEEGWSLAEHLGATIVWALEH